MEEQILDIMEDHLEPDFFGRYQTGLAKEIADHFLEFIEWITKNIQYNDVHDYYRFNNRIKGIILDFDTIEELYKYWLNNIK